MNFLNLAHNTIAISHNNFRKIFEKTLQARGLKLGSYVPLMRDFWGKKISTFMAENGP